MLEGASCHSDAEYLAVLADKMAATPARGGGGALFQNIQNGGRQSLRGGAQTLTSRPSMHAALAARVRAEHSALFVDYSKAAQWYTVGLGGVRAARGADCKVLVHECMLGLSTRLTC